ncbi:hypothetical protein FB45DRAFT_868935 [Roridomyces roridus]|uniref:Uncharacterized protein n=1 Tax=Roridomyces roridus TaxID=1738132 RepID=A0AAD7BN46_9AGAR|nr:hypothetical protein FB45DRAFT_868935 [Roridomyces roridus]
MYHRLMVLGNASKGRCNWTDCLAVRSHPARVIAEQPATNPSSFMSDIGPGDEANDVRALRILVYGRRELLKDDFQEDVEYLLQSPASGRRGPPSSKGATHSSLASRKQAIWIQRVQQLAQHHEYIGDAGYPADVDWNRMQIVRLQSTETEDVFLESANPAIPKTQMIIINIFESQGARLGPAASFIISGESQPPGYPDSEQN